MKSPRPGSKFAFVMQHGTEPAARVVELAAKKKIKLTTPLVYAYRATARKMHAAGKRKPPARVPPAASIADADPDKVLQLQRLAMQLGCDRARAIIDAFEERMNVL